ncbi:MAG: lipid-A-disaccharide synthase [Gemmatimonadetes bacterium]|nr:lipid-A-disaccharide synthase [Gemmatimonadota bacterium]
MRVREILFIAGETSGDLHGSGVARALREAGAPYALVGVGGDRMRAAGVTLVEHVGSLAHFGLVEPLRHLFHYRRLKRDLRARIESGRVALVVLIDYGGFNMQMAGVAARAGVPVLYFITPQVWASRAKRMRKLARTVTRAAVILPFEETLLRDNGVAATFVGHPLLDQLETLPSREAARTSIRIGTNDRLLVLFPGSRAQEIARHLDPFVATAKELQRRIPGLKVVVSAAPHVTIPPERCPYPLVHAASFPLLRAADAALCKSGTTTLEAAVALCPLVVAYRTDAFTYSIGKRLVTIPFIGLVNVVAGRAVAPEFVQDDLQPMAVADALEPLLDLESARRAEMVGALRAVRDSLGQPGAARRVADIALEMAGAARA